MVDVAHGRQDIFAQMRMFFLPVRKRFADAAADRASAQGTTTWHDGDAFTFAVSAGDFFVDVDQRADQPEVVLARVRDGGKRTEAARVHDVAEEGFAEIVGCVAESDDVGTQFAADLVDGAAAEAAAHVAAVVGLFLEQAQGGVVGVVFPGNAPALDVFADGLDRAEEFALFDREGAEGKVYRSAFLQQEQGFEQGDGILTTGHGYGDAVSVADHVEAMDCFAYFPQ